LASLSSPSRFFALCCGLTRCCDRSDIYSFAVVLWQLITGIPEPYEGYDSRETFVRAIAVDNVRPPLPNIPYPDLNALMQASWAPDPATRPTAPQLLERLSDCMIDVATQSEFVRAFWRRFYCNVERVAWKDFLSSFFLFTSLPRPVGLMAPTTVSRNTYLPDNPSPEELQNCSTAVLQTFMQRNPALALEEVKRRESIQQIRALHCILGKLALAFESCRPFLTSTLPLQLSPTNTEARIPSTSSAWARS
jgi:serine/threonine protein kinase